MSPQRLASLALATLLIGGAVALMALGDPPAGEPGHRERARAVRVVEASAARAPRELHFPGITRASSRARLSFLEGGRVDARPVEIGRLVHEGDVLARLDPREFALVESAAAAALAEVEARVAQVSRDRARVERLFAERAATREELEQVSAREDALHASRRALAARLDDARRRVEESVLRAPFDGIVRDVHVEPGEYARPGQTVVELDGLGGVELEVELPESLIDSVEPGAPATVALPLLDGRTVDGIVERVGRSAGTGGRLFPVVVSLQEGSRLSAGLTAELTLVIAEENALSLPLDAIVNPGGQRPSVFVVVNGVARRVDVEAGRVAEGRASVRGPIAPGDLVIVGGHASLRDGERVEVTR